MTTPVSKMIPEVRESFHYHAGNQGRACIREILAKVLEIHGCCRSGQWTRCLVVGEMVKGELREVKSPGKLQRLLLRLEIGEWKGKLAKPRSCLVGLRRLPWVVRVHSPHSSQLEGVEVPGYGLLALSQAKPPVDLPANKGLTTVLLGLIKSLSIFQGRVSHSAVLCCE